MHTKYKAATVNLFNGTNVAVFFLFKYLIFHQEFWLKTTILCSTIEWENIPNSNEFSIIFFFANSPNYQNIFCITVNVVFSVFFCLDRIIQARLVWRLIQRVTIRRKTYKIRANDRIAVNGKFWYHFWMHRMKRNSSDW